MKVHSSNTKSKQLKLIPTPWKNSLALQSQIHHTWALYKLDLSAFICDDLSLFNAQHDMRILMLVSLSSRTVCCFTHTLVSETSLVCDKLTDAIFAKTKNWPFLLAPFSPFQKRRKKKWSFPSLAFCWASLFVCVCLWYGGTSLSWSRCQWRRGFHGWSGKDSLIFSLSYLKNYFLSNFIFMSKLFSFLSNGLCSLPHYLSRIALFSADFLKWDGSRIINMDFDKFLFSIFAICLILAIRCLIIYDIYF